MTDKKESGLEDKVKDWLMHEGYPLEFATANCFRKHGFSVDQGFFTRDEIALHGKLT